MKAVAITVSAFVLAVVACSKIVGLALAGKYEDRDAVRAVLAEEVQRVGYRIIQSREICPRTDESKGYCSYFIAEEVQEVWNNPFTVILRISPAQGEIGVTMSRSMVDVYTDSQQAFALAVWNSLRARGITMHAVREEDTLQVPD
ncbi:MAG: hypothetical protein ACREXY_05870 [Gammaproteobacteria bacterium]